MIRAKYILIFMLRGEQKAYKLYYMTKADLKKAIKDMESNPDVKEFNSHELYWSEQLQKFVTIPGSDRE